MVAQFKVFKSQRESWEVMAQKAADFLTGIGSEKVISVSHSHESTIGTIIVWYWEAQ